MRAVNVVNVQAISDSLLQAANAGFRTSEVQCVCNKKALDVLMHNSNFYVLCGDFSTEDILSDIEHADKVDSLRYYTELSYLIGGNHETGCTRQHQMQPMRKVSAQEQLQTVLRKAKQFLQAMQIMRKDK